MTSNINKLLDIALKIVPFIFSRAAVFIANIVAAYFLQEDYFYQLTSSYIIAVMIATPLIAASNYYTNHVSYSSFNNVNIILILIGSTTVFVISLYLFDIKKMGIIFSLISFFLIYLSGVLNLRLISLGNSRELNNFSILGCFLFMLVLILYIGIRRSELIYVLYLAFPLVSLIAFIFCVNKKEKEKDVTKVSQLNVAYMIFSVLLGAPVHLTALYFLKYASSQFEVTIVNIAFQWFVMVTLLPGMIANVSVSQLRDKKYVLTYKKMVLLISLSLVFILTPIAYFSGYIYPSYTGDIEVVIWIYLACALMSVVYQSTMNELFGLGKYRLALYMAVAYAVSYLAGSFLIVDNAIGLGLVMLFSYVIAIFISSGVNKFGYH